jgi:hypothetical protein
MATGKYYILSDIKPMLSIAETDVEDDILLNNFGIIADRQVDNDLSHKLDAIPVPNASITTDLTGAANFYVAHQYKIKKQDFDGAKEFKQLYDNTIAGLIQRLTSDNTSHSSRVAINKGYTTSPLSDE